MNCTTADGLQLYYEVKGDPASKRTVVLLNGLTQSTAAWVFMLPYFKESRIILLDFIFQGQSDKKGEWRDFDKHAADVSEVLKQEKADKAVIIGISYGSLVAQHFALLYPAATSALVLISTFAHKTPYYDAIELGWWRALETGGYNLMLDVMLPGVLSEEYFSNPLIPIRAMKEMRNELNSDKNAILNLMKATRERKDFRNELRGIRAKTLIIQGEKDMLLPVHMAKEVHENIADSKLVIIPNAGHTLNLEHVAEVGKVIADFLGQIK
jgi:pimeloyl-ACP methyl ester carboxylesterase